MGRGRIADNWVMARSAARILLLDESDDVLLVRFHDGSRSWWCTPGGGIEKTESDEEALRREVREELGLRSFDLGPLVWTRRHRGRFRGRAFDQQERMYLARVDRFDPGPEPGFEQEHAVEDMRCWTVQQLTASAETFAPRQLPRLLLELLRDGVPVGARKVGV